MDQNHIPQDQCTDEDYRTLVSRLNKDNSELKTRLDGLRLFFEITRQFVCKKEIAEEFCDFIELNAIDTLKSMDL